MTRPPAAIATFGQLGTLQAKMGHGIARFCDHIVAVVDAAHAGRLAHEIEPYITRPVPVVADLDAACALGAEEIVLGGAPPGGEAGDTVIAFAREVLRRGLWLVSGLHTRLSEQVGASDRLIELRHLPVEDHIARARVADLDADVLLTVGSDCASGKMTTALELHRALRQRRPTRFVATGQTGMYVAGAGKAVDAVKSDFLAGVVEAEVLAAASRGGLVLVEGQGSLFHPAYSGVALGLLHGAAPNMLVFCHDVGRTELAYFGQKIGDLYEQIELTRRLAGFIRPTEVVAVSLMLPASLSDDQARATVTRLEAELGVMVVSPRTGIDRLVERLATPDGGRGSGISGVA